MDRRKTYREMRDDGYDRIVAAREALGPMLSAVVGIAGVVLLAVIVSAIATAVSP